MWVGMEDAAPEGWFEHEAHNSAGDDGPARPRQVDNIGGLASGNPFLCENPVLRIFLDDHGNAESDLILEEIAEEPIDINPKGHLQELLQSISPRSPVYELVSQSGPEHEKTFVVRAVWEGIVLGQGTGRSKKQAETTAALEAMKLKRWKTLG